ncbi:MAG: HNH endonuclease [Ilumatobacteraceae bacterium]
MSEYRKYHASKRAKTQRAQRNKNRRVMQRAGRVRKGDGKEVDHKRPMAKGGGNGRKNLRVVSRRVNRRKHTK